MTIDRANEYFAALPEGFAPAEELRAALPAAAQQVAYVGAAGTAGKTASAALIAAVLKAAGFVTGLYHAGCEPLAQRIRIEHQRVATRRVPHPHAAVRLRARGRDLLPHPELVQQARVVRRECVHAQVARFALPGRGPLWFHQRHLQALARQHQRRGRTDHATTRDHRIQQAAPTHAAIPRHSAGTSPR